MKTVVKTEDSMIVLEFIFEELGKRESYVLAEPQARNFKAQLEAALKAPKQD